MPIIFSDHHGCDNCKRTFCWSYFELQKQRLGASCLSVETIPTDRTLVHRCEPIGESCFQIAVNCPYCGYDNHFEYTKNE